MVVCIFNPSTEETEVGESLESEASPVYTMNSRLAKVIQQDFVSKKVFFKRLSPFKYLTFHCDKQAISYFSQVKFILEKRSIQDDKELQMRNRWSIPVHKASGV